MTALWLILEPLLAPIMRGLAGLGLYWKGNRDACVNRDLASAEAELRDTIKAAGVRRELRDLEQRHRLRVKYTKPK